MFLRGGLLEYTGSTKEAIDRYISSFSKAGGREDDPDRRIGSGDMVTRQQSLPDKFFGGAAEKVINFEIQRQGTVGFWVEDCPRISGKARFTTPWLKPGSYRVDLSVGASGIIGKVPVR